jgi:DNA-binding response OmpR family regulator
MSSEKILVVEDDKDIARLVQYNLGKAGYVAETAAD